MPSLSDLFVSYKNVAVPKPQVSTPVVEDNALNIQSAIDRYKRLNLDDNQTPAQISEDDVTAYNPEFNWDSLDEEGYPVENAQSNTQGNTIGNVDLSFRKSNDTKYQRGNLQEELNKLFAQEGINAKVTSFIRSAGQVGNSGDRSHHIHGNALDIIPGQGETFDSIKQKLINSFAINRFFKENKLGVLDETDPVVMQQTEASGKHFHIGPDAKAVETWNKWTDSKKKQWTQSVYNAFVSGLKREYGAKYDDSTYKRIAKYITQQAALESGYGIYGNGYNFGGHMRNGKTVNYSTMNDFVNAQINTLKKWDVMGSKSLKDYINKLYQGAYRYNAHDTADNYYNSINGTSNRINAYLARNGGKFSELRQFIKRFE